VTSRLYNFVLVTCMLLAGVCAYFLAFPLGRLKLDGCDTANSACIPVKCTIVEIRPEGCSSAAVVQCSDGSRHSIQGATRRVGDTWDAPWRVHQRGASR
jgi:hypothetical protein